MIRENPDGTRRQIDAYTDDEETDAAAFIDRYDIQPPEGWRRTGDVPCGVCGELYSRHHRAWPWLVLKRVCGGVYVKL